MNGQVRQEVLSSNEKILEYFKIDDLDASKVTWAHRVNSREKLEQAFNGKIDYAFFSKDFPFVTFHLAIDKSMFLEADILFIEELHSEPIMAHPPETQSDLKFSEWLDLTIHQGRGLKLDFKTANSIKPCLKLLNSRRNEVRFFQ